MSRIEDAGSAERRMRSILVSSFGTPFFQGNSIDILRNGVEIFPAMLDAIRQARKSVDFLTFVYWTGEVADRTAEALADAALRGVRVRVLLDGIGAQPMEDRLVEGMRGAGADVRWFRPLGRFEALVTAGHRTHRKILVCDDALGFTGGVGIGKEWEGDARSPDEWRETHFRLRGPAVQGLSAGFLENWLEVAQPDVVLPPVTEPDPAGDVSLLVVRSSASVGWSDRATLLQCLIRAAEHSVRISTPYFVPDPGSAELLAARAREGIGVEILVPGDHIDHRVSRVAAEAYYEDLLEAGVQLFEYAPTMIHQKITLVDDLVVSAGSANLNHRSLMKDDELQMVIVDRDFAGRIRGLLDEDFSHGVPVRPGRWKRRGLMKRAEEAATRLIRGQI